MQVMLHLNLLTTGLAQVEEAVQVQGILNLPLMINKSFAKCQLSRY